ncbi:serine hydrolase domain-containing protein [Streptomyces sp. NPDC050211]|uniref:serine hydrolase domain-containing protein n=1 Tax=Streptomyces sp. NPDC050211 TaxID=3154932 RepID=UPI003427A47B
MQSLLPEQVRAGNALSGVPITVRHLLNHTSGLYDYLDGLVPHFRAIDQCRPRDQLLGIGLAARYSPALGTRFCHCNTNYLLLDLIVERIIDRDLRTNLERRILAPLGLRDTTYPLASTTIDGAHAHGHTARPSCRTCWTPPGSTSRRSALRVRRVGRPRHDPGRAHPLLPGPAARTPAAPGPAAPNAHPTTAGESSRTPEGSGAGFRPRVGAVARSPTAWPTRGPRPNAPRPTGIRADSGHVGA